MTSQLDQGDLASFDRRVVEMKKTEGNSSSHTTSGDAEKTSESSSTTAMQQFQADWSHFETVFARGLSRRVS